jgi:hypothetical protein
MNLKLLNDASTTTLLTLITAGVGIAGTIAHASDEVRLATGVSVATCGVLATLKAYHNARNVAHTRGALQSLLAVVPCPIVLYNEIESAHLGGRRMEPIPDRLMFGDHSGSWYPDGEAVPRALQKIKQIAQSVLAGSLRQRGLYLSTEAHIRLCPFGVSVHVRPTPSLAIELAEPFIRRIRGMPPGERYGAVYAEAERQAGSVLLRKDVESRWRPPAMFVWFG